jgi:hypothetical protein
VGDREMMNKRAAPGVYQKEEKVEEKQKFCLYKVLAYLSPTPIVPPLRLIPQHLN